MTQIPGIRQERCRPSINDSLLQITTVFLMKMSISIPQGHRADPPEKTSACAGMWRSWAQRPCRSWSRRRKPAVLPAWAPRGGAARPDSKPAKADRSRLERRPAPDGRCGLLPYLPLPCGRASFPAPARRGAPAQKETSGPGGHGGLLAFAVSSARPRTGRSPGRIPDPRPHCGRPDANPYRA